MLNNIKVRIYFLVALICFNKIFVESIEYYTIKPNWFQTCRINEPEFTKCSTESVQKMMTYVIKEGIPEVTAKLGTLDPMKVDKIIFKQDNNQAVTITAELNNILAKGFSEMKIKESQVSKKDFSWQTKIFVPKLHLDGKYKMIGKILIIPLNGSGKFVMDIDNLDILMHTKTRLYEKGDFTFYNVTDVRVKLDMTGVRVNFENIFNGNNKEVESSTNDFFNENWREFFEALRPLITETVERMLLKILKESFDLLPANFLIEDIPTSEQLYKKKNLS